MNLLELFLTVLGISLVAGQDWEQRPGSSIWYFLSGSSQQTSNTWYEARAWCMERGGDLASIHSTEERDWLVTKMTASQFRGKYWIGLTNQLRDGFKWSDNTNLDQNLWAADYPKTDSVGWLCGYTNNEDPVKGAWYNDNCGVKMGFICKRPDGINTTPRTPLPTSSVSGYCPKDYTAVGNKCFKMVKSDLDAGEGLTWSDALTRCRQDATAAGAVRGDLASVQNYREAAAINAMIKDHAYGMWIGYKRNSFSEPWTWTDNSDPSFTMWGPGEPRGSSDHCAEIWINPGPPGTWNNIRCDSKRGYVCQAYKNPSSIINTPAVTSPGDCEGNYARFWKGCYRVVTEERSWEDAHAFCRQDGGNLVSIHHASENAYVFLSISGLDKAAWIGLNDRDVEGVYYWSDNWHVIYTNWGADQPSKPPGGGCVTIGRDGRWADSVCNNQAPFVCKKTNEPPLTTPPNIEGDCPPEVDGATTRWQKFGSYCYWTSGTSTKTFDDAQEHCRAITNRMGHLASMHSQPENQFIKDRAHEESASWQSSAWVGMKKDAAGQNYYWVDGKPVEYTNWALGEPNDEDGSENCVEMYSSNFDGGWNDARCSFSRPYICKVEKVPPPTTPPTPSPVSGFCPDGSWFHWGDDCIKAFPDEYATYSEARADCENIGATLVSLPDHPTNWYVHQFLISNTILPMDRHYWIGLFKQDASSSWSWVDGTEVRYENWEEGQPDTTDGKLCAEMYGGGGSVANKWRTTTCERRRGFACKAKKSLLPTPDGGSGSGGGSQAGPIAGIVVGVIGGCLLISGMAVFLVRSGRVPRSLPGLSSPSPSQSPGGNTGGEDGGFNNVLYNTKAGQASVQTNVGTTPGQLYADLGEGQPGRNNYMNASDA